MFERFLDNNYHAGSDYFNEFVYKIWGDLSRTFIHARPICVSNFLVNTLLFDLKIVYFIRLPWNQDTVIGWLGLIFYEYFVAGFYFSITFVFMTFFIAICKHHRTFNKYFHNLAQEIDSSSPYAEHLIKKIFHFHKLMKK